MATPANPTANDAQVTGLQEKEESQLVAIIRRFLKNRLAVIGLSVIILLSLIAILTPYIAPEPLDVRSNVPNRFQPPSSEHWLGTDAVGRDALSRVMWASRVSLSVGFVSMFVSVFIGIFVGALAGYYGGSWLDILLMRIAEAIDVIPVLFLLIMVLAVVGSDGLHLGPFVIPQVYVLMFVIGVTSWPSLAQIVRGQFLTLRQRDYSEASRALGASRLRIMFKHILPNAMAPIIVSATLRIGNGILAESGLSFLGLGTQPPNTSWGQLLSNGKSLLTSAPYLVWPPGLLIIITVMAFNLVGDGLRDALDPKMKL